MEWVFSGKIKYREDVQRGFENIPQTFLRLFSGDNQGKQLLQIAEPT
jgi:NADPH-dependent curcumin reductase CurA